MAKHQDGPLIGRQAPKATFELVPISDRQKLVPNDGPVGRQQANGDVPFPGVSRFRVTRMDE